jgi:Heavy metal binding domain
MDQKQAGQQAYTCPMHPEVRQQIPGTCSKCGMALMLEGTRFGMIRHMISNPLHLAIMVAVMIALMAVGMMIMR